MSKILRWTFYGILIVLAVYQAVTFVTVLQLIRTQLALAQTKEPVVQNTPTPQSTPIAVTQPAALVAVEPTAIPPTAQPTSVQPEPVQDWPSDLFRTPVQCQESFNSESSWIICEPGVTLDNTAAWVIPSVNATHFANVPEGGFTYFSLGQGKIVVDGFTIDLPYQEGNNYLVLIRGRIDDGIVDKDLNETAEVTDFIPGHAIWSIMPPGAYVSRNWFRQQLVVSTTTGGTNCGATGCSLVKVVLFDVDSHFYQMFDVHAGNLDNWTLVN